MRRIILVLAVAALMAALLVVAGPASAQAGCQDFGVGFVAANAPHGELASSNAPQGLDEEILGLHAAYCE
jgi:hypothetical protein